MSVQTDESFTAGNPEVVFEGDYHFFQGGPNYDVSPDGERFLMIKPVESASATSQIILVQNGFEELNRLAPPITMSLVSELKRRKVFQVAP